MNLRLLTLEELKYVHENLMPEAFPPEEVKSFEILSVMVQKGVYRTFGAYEEGEMVGYAFLWDWGSISLLDYLAVLKTKRNGGLGARILDALDEITEETLVIESEYPETEMQARRIGFYERNGFRFEDWDSDLFGVRYRIAARGEVEDLQKQYRALYQTSLPEVVYGRCVQIPYDGENPLPDCGEWLRENAAREISMWKRNISK